MAGNRNNVKDAQGLLKAAGDINASAGRFQAELSSLNTIVSNVTNVWEGDVKDAFDQKYYEKYQKYITEMIQSLEDYYKTMKKFADDEIAHINSGTSSINAL